MVKFIMLNKPEEARVELYVVDGEALCEYVADCFGIDNHVVYNIITRHHGINSDLEGHLFELIIEGEDYCNDEGIDYRVLEFIAEEFGGHFNINFLSVCAYI